MFGKSINRKLMVLFFAVGVSALSIVGIYAYFNAKYALLRRTLDQLTSIRVIKKAQLEFFLNERNKNITLLAENDYLKNIAFDLCNNMNHKVVTQKYPKFSLNYTLFGFSNMYLIFGSEKNSVQVYNFNGSEIEKVNPDTILFNQLSKLWKATALTNEPSFADFSKRFNDDNDPLCFIGKRIIESSKNIGILVLQIPIRVINNIMLEDSPENGLGKSGEVYLVGDDYLMRSNSRFIPNSVLNTSVKTISVFNAFKDKIGSSLIDDYRTVACLSSFDRLSMRGLNWAIIAEIDYSEAMIPIVSLRNDILFLSLIICIFLFSIAHFISRTITNPIIKLKNAALKIGEGDLDVNIKPKSTDEIGLLTEAFNIMAQQLKEERLKRMSALYDGQELERQRISRELHDGLGQKLISIKLQLESTSKQKADEVRSTIDEVKVDFLKTIEEVRQISNNLAPNILKESGIDVALKNLCDSLNRTSKINIELSVYGDYSISEPKVTFYLYRITQEGLNNAIKHSGATKVQLQLIGSADSIILLIEDNGKGFMYDPNFCTPCNGIYNMKERARLLNGTLDIESEPLSGTTIRLKIPKPLMSQKIYDQRDE
jgi:two-component system NarL family sensor kinase